MSYPTSNTYETVYILKSGLSDSDAQAIHQKVDAVIHKFAGSLKSRDDWGLTQLAYPINDDSMGRYTIINYVGRSGVVEEIERHFKIIENVIRFLTVQVPKTYSYEKIKTQIGLAEEEMRKNKEMRDQRKRISATSPQGM